jgi:hypothetical protein
MTHSLHDLYFQKLGMIYDAEQQVLQAMPQIAQKVQNERLRSALDQHRGESEEQVRRLQQLFQAHEQQAERKECTSMRALIQEAQTNIGKIQDPDALDAFIIGAAGGGASRDRRVRNRADVGQTARLHLRRRPAAADARRRGPGGSAVDEHCRAQREPECGECRS